MYSPFYNPKQNSVLSCVSADTVSGNEIVSLADAKLYARITSSSEDSLFTALVTAARKWIEEYLNRSIVAKNIVITIFNDGTFSELLPYGNVTGLTKVERRYGPLEPWVDVTNETGPTCELQDGGKFFTVYPAFYRITYTTVPDLSPLSQLQLANKQLVNFFYENRGEQQIYQMGGAREATRVVPDVIKNTLAGLRTNAGWF